jgi:hypothetical protein
MEEESKVVQKLDEEKFAAEVSQKLEQIKLETSEELKEMAEEPKVDESIKRKSSISNFFNSLKGRFSGLNDVTPSTSDLKIRKSSSSRLNRLFGKKKDKEVTEEQQQKPVKQRSFIMKFISRPQSQLNPVRE